MFGPGGAVDDVCVVTECAFDDACMPDVYVCIGFLRGRGSYLL